MKPKHFAYFNSADQLIYWRKKNFHRKRELVEEGKYVWQRDKDGNLYWWEYYSEAKRIGLGHRGRIWIDAETLEMLNKLKFIEEL